MWETYPAALVVSRLATECEFKTLQEITKERIDTWVTEKLNDRSTDFAASTINAHIRAIKAFCSWCTPKRLASNPLAKFKLLDDTNNQKRPRRALEVDEISRLLLVARLRPIAEYGRSTVRRQTDSVKTASRATWTKEPLAMATIYDAYERGKQSLENSDGFLEEMERLGEERELLYLVLLTTGLRKGELASISIGNVYLEDKPPWIKLSSQDEKAGRGASIPLRDDISQRLRDFLSKRLERFRIENSGGEKGAPSLTLPLDQPLFTVPRNLVAILRRDMAVAGIPKIDDRGRTVDVHALRHTFGTMLHRAGVSPAIAQVAMRHSDIKLTMNIYNHLGLADVVGAIRLLPRIADSDVEPAQSLVTSAVTSTDVVSCHSVAQISTQLSTARRFVTTGKIRKLNGKPAISIKRVMGFEPTTFSLGS